jgi:hypothetical protein
MAMPAAPIAANLHKALDIKVNLFSKLPLYPVLPVNNLPKTINLSLGKIVRLNLSLNPGLNQNPLTQRRANAVDIL